VVAVVCYNAETLLPYATAGVAVAGTAIAIATISAGLPTEVYAAAAALLAVLADCCAPPSSRAGPRCPEPAAPGGTTPRRGRPSAVFVGVEPRNATGGLLRRARPAGIRTAAGGRAGDRTGAAVLAPALAAALIGPYRWIDAIWKAPGKTRPTRWGRWPAGSHSTS